MPFTGFSKECVKFYQALIKNNNKTWFDNHKNDYEYYVMNPARDFVVDMGKMLQKISPGIHADPRVNKSLFRIYRDTRFSNDKTPFKTNLGIWFWEGDGKRFDYSGFYFHLEPPNIMLAAGKHKFEPDYMKAFRDSVVHEIHGPKLIKAIKQVEKAGYQVGSKQYKKTPRGYDKDHPYAEYLLLDGLYGFRETKIPQQFYSDDLIEYSYKIFKAIAPVHKWLVEMIRRIELV